MKKKLIIPLVLSTIISTITSVLACIEFDYSITLCFVFSVLFIFVVTFFSYGIASIGE